MTTMTSPNANGRKRPNLGEQINRLDSMLDGLSEALNDAVADAVKVAIGGAVPHVLQSVLTEVLTNPEIRAKLYPPMPSVQPPPAVERISLRQRLNDIFGRVRTYLSNLRTACAEKMAPVKKLISRDWRYTIDRVASTWRLLRPFKSQILLALGIGVMIGVGVWYAGPWIGAVASGVGGFATALSVQAGLWVRKLFAGDVELIA
jgi:hypothetical protein